jgi:hypothetical protein
MATTAQLPYDRAVDEVGEMTKRSTSLAQVEDAIARANATEDEEAALWLFAWSLRGSSRSDAPGKVRPNPGAVRGRSR